MRARGDGTRSDVPTLVVERAGKSVMLPTGKQLRLFDELDLQVSLGDSLAVTGRSGAGKTTLLRALGLFTPFDSGAHRLMGVDVRSATDAQCSRLRARRIGFVFQDFQLLPGLTAAQNVEYAGVLAGMGRRERVRAAREALARVGLTDRSRSRPAVLSGGEQQRVAIARALVKAPTLVLADEPTGALDRETADHVMDLLMEAVAELGAAIVIVTHDERVARRCRQQLRLGEESGRLDPVPATAEGAGTSVAAEGAETSVTAEARR